MDLKTPGPEELGLLTSIIHSYGKYSLSAFICQALR